MRKNFILRTALSLLVLLCSAIPMWGDTYKKITSIDELVSGKQYVIVCPTKSTVMGAQSGTYRTSVDVTITDNVIQELPSTAATCVIEEGNTAGQYTIKCSDGYLYWDSGNSVKTGANTYAWTITIDGETTTIVSAATSERKLQYNASSPRFACYTSSQTAIALYKLDESVVSLTEATISFDGITGDVTKYLSEGGYDFTVITNSTATVQYSSSNTDVAEITDGLILFNAPGETVIKAWVEQNDAYTAAETSYTLTVVDDRDPQLAFPEGITNPYIVDISLGSFDSRATSASGSTGAITYASSVEEVAMIDENGEVVLMGAGETEISATIDAAGTYATSTIKYVLKVTKKEPFKKVTDGKIPNGRYIIACASKGMAMNTTNPGKYFDKSAVTITDDVIETYDATIIWTITEKETGKYTITNGEIYVAYTGDSNAAQAIKENNETSTWTITVAADGVATITNVASSNRVLKYNSSSPRFACYTSGQTDLTLYRYDDGKQETAIVFPEELGIDENGELMKKYVPDATTFSSAAVVSLDDVVDATIPVVYSSENPSVAEIDASTGLVTLKGVAGSTMITATVEATDTYRAASVSYTLTVSLLSTPELSFAESAITKTVVDAPFTNALTVLLNGVGNTTIPVKYTSSVETVATIDEATGEVTIVGKGESVIKAEIVAAEAYEAASAEYALTVTIVPKTFAQVTNGKVGYGEYLVIGVDANDVLAAMDKTLGGEIDEYYLTQTEVIAAEDGTITTTNENLLWIFTQEIDGNWSIRTVGDEPFYIGYNSEADSKDNYIYPNAAYTEDGKSAWIITAGDDMTFVFSNIFNADRRLRYNNQANRFAGYISSGNQKDLLLYRLVTHKYPMDGEQPYTGSYVKTFSMVSQLWSNGGFELNLHPAESHNVYLDYTDPFYDTSFPLLNGEENVTISTACHIAEGGSLLGGYLYVDWNNDGEFDPATELVVSAASADAMPAFNVDDVVPEGSATGLYRARFEVDTDSSNPATLTGDVANGAIAVDFDVNYLLEEPQAPDPNNPTHIEEVENGVVLYYADGAIYTHVEGEIAVYDLAGKLVRRAQAAPVAVDDLADGVYIVKVGGETLKFVK